MGAGWPGYVVRFTAPRDDPGRGYNRYQIHFVLTGQVPLQAGLHYLNSQRPRVVPGASLRYTLNGAPITPWLTPDGEGYYVQTLDTLGLPEGPAVLGTEVTGAPPGSLTMDIPVEIDNDAQPVLNPPTLPVVPDSWSMYFLGVPDGVDAVPYPPPARVERRGRARPAVPYPGPWPTARLWAQRMGGLAANYRRVYQRASGHLTTAYRQFYFYGDYNTMVIPPQDGERNVARIGTVVGALEGPYKDGAPNPGGCYHVDSQGRLAWTSETGRTTTLVGYRLRAGKYPLYWGDLKSMQELDPALLEDRYELRGNFLSGPRGLNEPWDIMLDERTRATQPPGWHQYFVTDTLNHCLRFIDHYPAHTPGQQSTVEVFAGPLDATPGYADGPFEEARFDEPWGCAMTADGTKIYMTDRMNAAIRVLDLTTRQVETVVRSALVPTLADLGIAKRDQDSSTKQPAVDARRATYALDGLPGMATLCHPQGCRLTSDETHLVFAERHTFAIRKVCLVLGPDYGHVTTLAYLGGRPSWIYGQALVHDITLNLDRTGALGPVDDIFVAAWHSRSMQRFGIDGTFRDQVCPETQDGRGSPLAEGPMERVTFPAYPWLCLPCPSGALWCFGGGGGPVRVTVKQPDDPIPDLERYERGARLYVTGRGAATTTKAPSFWLLHNSSGEDGFGMATFDDDGQLPFADFAAKVRGGWGGTVPRPELTDEEIADLHYYVQWGAQFSEAIPAPPPPPPPPVTPTAIIAIRAGFGGTVTTAPFDAPVDVEVILKDGATGRVA